MNRAKILDTAKEFIMVDRAATHGSAEDNFGLIAAYWSAHLNRTIKPHDVAVMMTLMKLARAKSNPKHIDNWIDGCGYLALGGETATRAAMVYTMREIRLMLADRPLPTVAKQSGVAHTTLWRLISGRQEARESTLVKLTDYINRAMQDG